MIESSGGKSFTYILFWAKAVSLHDKLGSQYDYCDKPCHKLCCRLANSIGNAPRGLAKTAIAGVLDLPPSGDSAKDIAQAEKIMTDAANDADNEQYAEAIQDYSQVWSIAESTNSNDHHFKSHCDYHGDYGNH